MASMDAPTLEFFVQDSFFGNVTDAQIAAIVALLEPEREWIENLMESDYEPEEYSWRDYRNGMWYSLEQYDAQIKAITDERQPPAVVQSTTSARTLWDRVSLGFWRLLLPKGINE